MRVVVLILALFLRIASAEPTTVATSQPLAREQLAVLYEAELGTAYQSASLDKLLATQDELEKYFAGNAQDRAAAIEAIRKIGLDETTIGKICRIRSNWPAMKGGVYYINEKLGPHNVHYFLGIPDNYDRLKKWPLVVKLPTATVFVTEPKPDSDQVAKIYTDWILDELKTHPDAVVVMPLLNLDELYGPSYTGMNSVMKSIQHATSRVNIDPAKVYLIGHSMSAHAVWNLALHYPTYFAAINPLAGGASAAWQRLRVMNLRNVLPVVWHDSSDKVIKVDSSRQIVQILKRFNIPANYEETKDVGHDPTPEIWQRCYIRTRSKTRDLYPKQITLQSNRLDTIFNRIDWLQVYQPLNPGEDQKLLFRRGTGIMLIQSTTWSADAKRNGNRFDIDTKNVEVLRLYVNDQLIDFKEPVTVAVNKKIRFEGMVSPSVEELLHDQVFLGRGWRYFTGVIDIDLRESPATKPSATLPTKPTP
jgi:hypothetical protein